MDRIRRGMALLESADWGQDREMIEGLKAWYAYPLLTEALQNLELSALYKSSVHGSGHINRVLLMSGLIAWQENLSESLIRQYFAACSYHDVGRYFDGLDLDHGSRAAEQLATLTGFTGEALKEVQAAVAAHSQPDQRMEEMLALYAPADMDRTRHLACLLKDADNLDRVRLGDLKPEFLRSKSAKGLVAFSARLLTLDQALKRQMG